MYGSSAASNSFNYRILEIFIAIKNIYEEFAFLKFVWDMKTDQK